MNCGISKFFKRFESRIYVKLLFTRNWKNELKHSLQLFQTTDKATYFSRQNCWHWRTASPSCEELITWSFPCHFLHCLFQLKRNSGQSSFARKMFHHIFQKFPQFLKTLSDNYLFISFGDKNCPRFWVLPFSFTSVGQRSCRTISLVKSVTLSHFFIGVWSRQPEKSFLAASNFVVTLWPLQPFALHLGCVP